MMVLFSQNMPILSNFLIDKFINSATKFGVTGFMMGLQEYIRRRGLDKNICCTIVMPDVISTREDVINAVSKT